MVYMVTYDLNTPGQKYEQVLAVLDFIADGSAVSFWRSSYLIKTNLTPNQIMDKLQPYLDENDKVLIIEVGSNYSDWLESDDQQKLKELL